MDSTSVKIDFSGLKGVLASVGVKPQQKGWIKISKQLKKLDNLVPEYNHSIRSLF